jgi:ferredoxin-NADP reductase
MAFWFDTNGASYQFRPGQHADFSFFHPSPEQKADNSRTFSLANSPQDKGQIMIAMRLRETPFKTALKASPVGTQFKVSRARGSFTLHKELTRPAVFLAGGIGITPIRRILQWATKVCLPHKLYLFYSNRHLEDAAFLEEFEDLATQNPYFKFIATLTGTDSAAWHYEHGPIDHSLLTQYLHSLNGPVYYAAGPSGMVSAIASLLRGLGVSDDDMKAEEFGDYRPPSPSDESRPSVVRGSVVMTETNRAED